MRLVPLVSLALLVSACGDSKGSETSASTTTSSTGSTSEGTTTEAPIDCKADNACVLYPDQCTGWCYCDNKDYEVEKCVETEAGEFLVQCTEKAQGISVLCPYGCDDVYFDPPKCLPPEEECGVEGECGATPGCSLCACPFGGGESSVCLGDFIVERIDPEDWSSPCKITEHCAFGCDDVGNPPLCCLDGACKYDP
ncbi:hypothetical protein [Nannocystis punicea]|uniref:Thyroglobulin type-1 domain-containing protein n=1 Tax=Nannocystis punicea TaxID=2995304 RepID=A0ABY7GUP4_9BACT|nr:hypothetical protein [Nannocystis poenicansa]WAS90686.1 hypothetical protein O0S08_31245 [Nannocystis poenicansa]